MNRQSLPRQTSRFAKLVDAFGAISLFVLLFAVLHLPLSA